MLKFPGAWRFDPPADGRFLNRAIPAEAVRDFNDLIGRLATQGDRWGILEQFKDAFCSAAGTSYSSSSSQSWAETDLGSAMRSAAANAPLFLEALYDACETLRAQGLYVPDAAKINSLCEKHEIGYLVSPPDLVSRDKEVPPVPVPERPPYTR